MGAPRPDNELERLRALRRYRVLDTAAEESFDRITRLCASLFRVPVVLVSLIDEDRQWNKSCFGLDVREADRELSFCAHVILSREPLIVEDARRDPRFQDHPFVTQPPHVCFYAGVPLTTPDGFNLGSLCVIDFEPRTIGKNDLSTLIDLSRVVVDELELRLGNRDRALLQKVCELSPALTYLYEPDSVEPTFVGRHLFAELGYGCDGAALAELIHPDDVPLLEQRRSELKRGQRARVELCYRARDSDGAQRWLLAHETVFERAADGSALQMLGVLTDITDLKTTEASLARSEELLAERVRILEGVLESAGDGIIVADESGRYTIFNRAARELLGGAPGIGAVLGGQRPFTLHRPDTGEPFPEPELPLARALRGEPSDNVELCIRAKCRTDRLIRATGRPLTDASGQTRGAIASFNDITALRAAERELAERAITDALTGLPNRRAFDERLALLIAEGARGRQFALVLCDVDHFKRVNDTHGHAVGDEVLAHVGRTLRQSVRRTDFVGRYGGEEFCILLCDVDEAIALRLADGLRRELCERPCRVAVTLSFGVCLNRPHEQIVPARLIEAADQGLYAAKSQGRNRVVASQLPAHAPAHRSRAPAPRG